MDNIDVVPCFFLTHSVEAGLKRAARGSLEMQDAKIRHLRTIAHKFVRLYLRN